MNWPNDADGDVLRRLESDGFDFNKEHSIDFNIDFDIWPLSDEAIKAIENQHPGCEFIDPDEEDIKNGDTNGYVQFRVKEKLTYNLVTNLQKEVTNKVKQYGGWCESWGLFQN